MILSAIIAAALAAHGHGPRKHPAPPAIKPAAQFTSYTDDFAKFADETATLPEAERVRLFHKRFSPLAGGFYGPRDRDPAKVDANIASALKAFPTIRVRYTAAAANFAQAFATGQTRFRTFFPDYRLTMPVYLVHSLGEMDGGTRELQGRSVAVFGADVIARIHDETTIPPFLDHELFHLYHAQYFPDCDALWCGLWEEGLAVYVASRMNPGATDRQLLLTIPVPIRAAVDPHLAEAICGLRAKLDATATDDKAPFFFMRPSKSPFPPRYGYYLGLLLAQKIGEAMPLAQMAKLPPAQVRPLLDRALASYGACPASVSAG
ncbi:MAG: hypothetical protein ABI471_04500 [Sphingomonas bacterium]